MEEARFTRRQEIVYGLLVSMTILLLVEGTCRWREDEPVYRASELLGYELAPGTGDPGEETNAQGLRGAEIAEKRPGDFRVLAMGGSTTWGHRLRTDEAWPFVLQQRLREQGHARVEVMNGGVSGWGLEQIALALEDRYLDTLLPDLVLVYSGWNSPRMADSQFLANFRAMSAASEHKHVIFHSALVRYLERRLQKWKLLPGRRPPPPEAPSDRVRAIRESFPSLLARVAASCQRRGVALAVIRFPALAELPSRESDPHWASFEETFMHHRRAGEDRDALLARETLEAPQMLAAVVEAAEASRVPVLDVTGAMQAKLLSRGDVARRAAWASYFRDEMHTSALGNRAIAEALAALLVERGMVPGRAGDGQAQSSAGATRSKTCT